MSAARFLPLFSGMLCLGTSPAGAIEFPLPSEFDVKLAAFSVPHDPLKAPVKEKAGTTHITLVLVGDTGYAPHGVRPNPKGVSKHGYWQSWDQTTRRIRNEINGDINFANIETVISANGRLRRWPKAYNFVMHPNGARHLVDIGFNLFSMANNHSFDFGAGGIRDSVKYAERLKANGLLAHAGIGLNRTQAAHVPVFSSKDTRFAFGALGIGATYGGRPRASDSRPGQLGINNKSDVRLLMNNLKKADADYRMLSLHRGYERIIRVDGNEIRQIRKNMLEQGDIDLLIGHHAHVTRGVEINNGRLIFYGLGNFLHQGTANMAKHGRCRDYSIIARVHLVRKGRAKPQLAAVEVVPITETHRQVRPMRPRRAAKSVAILNGLARQFDNPGRGARGVRFSIRGDGSGLYCTPAAAGNASTSSLCLDYDPDQISRPRVFRAALSTCGRSYSPTLVARRSKPRINKVSKPAIRPGRRVAALEVPIPAKARVIATKPDSVVTRFPAARGKQVYDAGLLRPDLKAMAPKDVKAYWTLVWYTRKGKTPPQELAQIVLPQKPVVQVTRVALLDAWNTLRLPKAGKVEPVVQPKRPAVTKGQLAAAWASLPSPKPPVSGAADNTRAQSDSKVALAAAWANLVVKPAVIKKPETAADGQLALTVAWNALGAKKTYQAQPSTKYASTIDPKIALETAWAALSSGTVKKTSEVAKQTPVADTQLELAAAWNALAATKVSPSQPSLKPKPKAGTQIDLAKAWAALGSSQKGKSATKLPVVAKLADDVPSSQTKVEIKPTSVAPKKPNRKAVYDAGLERPDFKKMTKKQIKAYWTRVWYARRDLRRKRRAGRTS